MTPFFPALGRLFGVVLAFWLAGCAGSTSPDLQPTESARIMVTLPTDNVFVIRQSIQELSATYGLRVIASWKMESLEQQCVVFETPSGQNDRLVRSLMSDHRTEIAQPVSRFFVEGASQEGAAAVSYRRFQHAADLLRLDQAHQQATGRGVRIAVIDTGADIGHPEYAERIVAARDFSRRESEGFTKDLHGTAVAGLIAASRDDERGIIGTAPGAELEIIKACWAEPVGGRKAICDSYTLALALDSAATSGSRIINLSLTGPEDPILRRLLEAAMEKRMIVVSAMASETSFPANLAGVLAVRAMPGSDERELVSVADGKDYLSAPGEEVLTTTPGGSYDFWNGSSMSAAQVAGVVALLLELRPELNGLEAERLLRDSALENPGHGIVDACAAVALLTGKACA